MKIGIIGGGAMGGTLARRLFEISCTADAKREEFQITVTNPHIDKLNDLKEQGAYVSTSNFAVLEGADLVVIAVKPWKVKEVIEEIAPFLEKNTEVSLIVAGISGEDLINMFGEYTPSNLSVAMPNTAMQTGKSMTFIVPLKGNPALADQVFQQVGKVKVIEEKFLPAATALASCGIAYALRYVRAATEGGVELGFKAEDAQEIVARTIEGAVSLLKPGVHAEAEIDKVTTPGGLTIKGLNAMEKFGFSTAVIEGLKTINQKR